MKGPSNVDDKTSGDDMRRDDEPQVGDEQEPIGTEPQAPTDDAEGWATGDTEPPAPYASQIWIDPDLPEPDRVREGYEWPPAAPAPKRSSGLLTSVLLIVLALGLVAATVWGVFEYRRSAMARTAAREAVALIGEGAPPELAQEVAAIETLLTAGQADEAAQKLAGLRAMLAQKPGGQGSEIPIPEAAYQDIPADAAKFFRGHQDLFRQFLLMCTKSRELRDQGQNVDALRKVRDQVLEAARLGRVEGVQAKMAEMMAMLRGQGGPDGAGPGRDRGPLARKAARLKQEVERARSQRRDVRAVFGLMRKAEQAAQAGKMAEAEKFLDQALAAVRQAPRAMVRRGRDARSRAMMARRGRQPNNLAPFVRALLGVMGAEENNLKVISSQLVSLRQALTGEQPQPSDLQDPVETPQSVEVAALKPMVDRAIDEMQVMATRRQELSRQMRGGAPASGQAARPPRPDAAARRATMAILAERLTPVLDRLRAMSDDEYRKEKGNLIRDIVRAVLAPPQRPQTVAPKPQPPADPEERVRAKLLETQPVLAKWKADGKDTAEIEDLLAQARKALYAEQFEEAEKQVDEARKLLGMDEAAVPGAAEPGPRPGVDGVLRDDDAKLDLRGTL